MFSRINKNQNFIQMNSINKMLGNRFLKSFQKICIINIIDDILLLVNLAKSFPEEKFLICPHHIWEEAEKICSSSCSRIGDSTFSSDILLTSYLCNIF